MRYKNFAFYLLPWIWLLVALKSPISAKISPQGFSQNPGFVAMFFGISCLGFTLLPYFLHWLKKKSWKYPLRTRSRKAFWYSFLFGVGLSLCYSLSQSLIRRGTPIPDHFDAPMANVIAWSVMLAIIPLFSWVDLLISRYWIEKSLDQGPLKASCLFTLFHLPLGIVFSLFLEPSATTSSWVKSLLLDNGLSILNCYAMLLCIRWITLEFKGVYAGCLYYTSFMMCSTFWDIKHILKSPKPSLVEPIILYGCAVGGAFLLTKFSQSIKKHRAPIA